MQYLHIKELEVETLIGVNPEEKDAPQKLVLNLQIGVRHPQNDSLDETLDYSQLTKDIVSFSKSNECDLIETFAQDLANLVFQSDTAENVWVHVYKPVASKIAEVSYELFLSKKKLIKVYLALGSNLGNKAENIQKAIDELKKYLTDVKVSEMHETQPMYEEDQPEFINAAISGETDLGPRELLLITQKIEQKIGRQETYKNGPREIDIDIIFYGDLRYKDSQLEIPHPYWEERDFVKKPLKDLGYPI